MKRYKVKPERLGEINIDEDENGEFIYYDDYVEQRFAQFEQGKIQIMNIVKEFARQGI
ncbi:MAG: hypothetical protein ACYDEI_00225 [Erysipelotrichaceae bacterium]